MRAEIARKSKMYKVFNDITLKNEIIIFGSTFAAGFPFYELSKKYLLSNAIYNRSIEGITISEANEIIGDCVFAAKPAKIFYAFDDCDTPNYFEIYDEILHKTKKALPSSKIYVLSPKIVDESSISFYEELLKLCKKSKVSFIDIDYTKSCQTIFKQISPFFRDGKISFEEAFKMN